MSTSTGHIAFFPGSFDPPTKGHFAIVQAILPLFSKLVIGIGQNSQKSYAWSAEVRKKMLEDMFRDQAEVQVIIYEGMTIDAAERAGARFLIRGIRDEKDSAYERQIAEANRLYRLMLKPFLFPHPPVPPTSTAALYERFISTEGTFALLFMRTSGIIFLKC